VFGVGVQKVMLMIWVNCLLHFAQLNTCELTI
jgi:hypothetical protein